MSNELVKEIIKSHVYGMPVLIEKTVSANGTYIATDDGADGYSKVTVNV